MGQTWSNGNLFRSFTLLAVTCAEQRGCELKEVLTAEDLAQFGKMLEFDKYAETGRFDVKIEGLGLRYYVSQVEKTFLKDSKVGKHIPTVAEVTQGEVISFVNGALAKMAADGMNVLLEGREQTLNHIRSPHRFELVLEDLAVIGMRQAALQMGGKAYDKVKDTGGDVDEIKAALDAALKELSQPTSPKRQRGEVNAETPANRSSDEKEYTIVLQKDEGTVLGIDVELKEQDKLFVRSIDEQGLVAGWNRANPDQQVKVGHVMTKVNDGSTSILAAVNEGGELNITFEIPDPNRRGASVDAKSQATLRQDNLDAARSREIEASPEPVHEFSVILDKPLGTSLGLDVTQGRGNKTLLIKEIKAGGPAETWNNANPARALLVLDEIVQVNAATGDVKALIDECKKAEILEMKVRRLNKDSSEI